MAQKEPLVSVIIPVYNVEKYLDYCLKSVFLQIYRKMEIILVDDGSTDSSGEMCDYYRSLDDRIKVIHKTNGGLSSARNIGIKESSGEYITFLDSDDYIRKDFVKKLMDIMIDSESDIVVGSYMKVYDNLDISITDETLHINQYEGADFSYEMLSQKLPMYAHGKLYKRELFEEIQFPDGRWFEDVPTLWKISKLVKRAAAIDNKLYFYRQREGSIVNLKFTQQRMDQLYFAEEIFADVQNNTKFMTAAGTRCFFSAADTYFMINAGYKSEKEYLKEAIKKYRKYVISNTEANFEVKVLAFLSYVSLKLVKNTGRVYKDLKYRKAKR